MSVSRWSIHRTQHVVIPYFAQTVSMQQGHLKIEDAVLLEDESPWWDASSIFVTLAQFIKPVVTERT